MPILSRSKYKRQLDENIELIKRIIPDFHITEEQYNQMISDERWNVFLQAQNAPTNSERIRGAEEEISKYCTLSCMPRYSNRNRCHMVRLDKTPEAEEYNRRLFSDLNRDDSLGEQARINYIFKALNTAFELGSDKLSGDLTPSQMLQLSEEKFHIGGIAMEMEHILRDADINIKPEFRMKWKIACELGSSAGGVLRDFHEHASNPLYLTLPLDFMTPDQLSRLARATGPDYDGDVIFGLPKDDAQNFVNSAVLASGIKDDIRRFNEITGNKPFSMDEFEYTKPLNARIAGGLRKRIEALDDGLKRFEALPEYAGSASLQEIDTSCKELLNKISSADDLYDDELSTSLAEGFGELAKQLNKVKNDAAKKAPKGELFRISDSMMSLVYPMRIKGYVPEQLRYLNEDEQMLKNFVNDYAKSISESLEPFKYADSYGKKQIFSEEDLIDVRARLERTIFDINSILESNTNVPTELTEAAKLNLEKLQAQSRAFNHASAGMTLDQIMQHSARTVDLSGNKLGKLAGSYSSRLFMTITGPDGSMQDGFFTEAVPLDVQEKKAGMIASFVSRNPQYKDAIEAVINNAISMIEGGVKIDDFAKNLQDDINVHQAEDDFNEVIRDLERALISYKKTYDKYTEQDCSRTSRVDLRNVAMSDIAHDLGLEGLIAKSTPLTVINNGVQIHGIFMEKAQGCDINRVSSMDDPLLKIKADSLDGSPALKQIADLQILDYICGNSDRHAGNMLYQVDDDGRITGIIGIDNDLAFLPKPDTYAQVMTVNLDTMNCISESLAKKIENCSPASIENILSVNSLGQAEIADCRQRLESLKDAIKTGRLPVKPDADFANAKLEEFLSPNGNNHFNQIKDSVVDYYAKATPDTIRQDIENTIEHNRDKIKETRLDLFETADKACYIQDRGLIEDHIRMLDDATKSVYFGSEKYENVQNALRELHQQMLMIKENPLPADENTLERIMQAYSNVEKKCDAYIKYKTDRKEMTDKGKTGKRINAVQRLREFCKNKAKALDYTLNVQAEKQEMKKISDKLQMENMTPQIAGSMIKALNARAQQNPPLGVQVRIAEQMQLVTKYMKLKNVSLEECNLSGDEMEAVRSNIQKGRTANMKLRQAEKEQAAGMEEIPARKEPVIKKDENALEI